jgi:hypothetical protein
MPYNLPSKRTLGDFKKEARILLHDLQRQDAAAVKQYYLLDPEAGTSQTRLTDAQYVIARRYGCRSWRDFEQRLKRKSL